MSAKYTHYKDFIKSVQRLYREGGRNKKAADQIDAILGRIARAEDDPFHGVRMTKHGENRIENCIKYDLTNFIRLVTIKVNGVHCLLYAGRHEATDKWLDRNSGLQIAVNEQQELEAVKKSSFTQPEARVSNIPDNYDGKILDRLELAYRSKLLGELPSRITEPLRELEAGCSVEAIKYAVKEISDEHLQQTSSDVLSHLNAGDVDSAKSVIDLYLGRIASIETVPDDMILKVQDGGSIRSIPIGSAEYLDWLKKFISSSTYYDWLLFMHPEQEKFVASDYSGPAKLSGVSGAGKTCIAVQRSIRLAKKYDDEAILLLTLNRSLSNLISELVDHACPDAETRKRIEVKSFFELCQELLHKFEPENDRRYSDVTWGLEEHIDEVYREFYRCESNVNDAEVLLPLHRSLMSQRLMAENYIRDEFDWIRSACSPSSRPEYLDMERAGRGYGIDKRFRKLLLEGLTAWEKKMDDIGVIDYLGLSNALFKHIDKILPQYRSILVDEAQDFGTTELAIIRRLVGEAENDIFLCGDLAQHILPKHQKFDAANIQVSGRSHSIHRNYRNSREILKAAYDVLIENLDESLLKTGELEILDPDYANRSSSEPVVLKGNSLGHEIASALELMKENADVFESEEIGREHKGCIVIAGHSLYEVSIFGEKIGIPTLDGTKANVQESLVLSDLEQTKGYEFDTVVIANCSEKILPPDDVPENEAFRYGCQLYVAMTRAKDQLVLSYSEQPSKWLVKAGKSLTFDNWESFIDVPDGAFVGEPGHLPEVIDSDMELVDFSGLNGRQFLYTSYARGLPVDIQDKIEEKIDGRGLRSGRNRIKWKDIGQISEDIDRAKKSGRVGHFFGPVADDHVASCIQSALKGVQYIAYKERKKSAAKQQFKEEYIYLGNGQKAYIKRVSQLNLSDRAKKALESVNIKNISALRDCNSRTLLQSPEFSPKLIKEIRAALKAISIDW